MTIKATTLKNFSDVLPSGFVKNNIKFSCFLGREMALDRNQGGTFPVK